MPPHIAPMMRASMESAIGDVAELTIAIDGRTGDLKEIGAKVARAKTNYKALRKRVDDALQEAAAAKADIEPLKPAVASTAAIEAESTQLESGLPADAQVLHD